MAIATPQAAATEAGKRAFEEGGNAFDACLAAALSLAVIYPDNCGIGGDLIALVRRSDGTQLVINGSGPAAADVDITALRRAGDRMPLTGPDPVTVPGMIGGLSELHAFGARLGWGGAFTTAIRQAKDGVTVLPSLARSIAAQEKTLSQDAGCQEVFFKNGQPLKSGDLLRQPALAQTLETLAADGPDAFYRGSIGRSWITGLRSLGSRLVFSDMATFVPERVTPHKRTAGPLEVVMAPPNSQGFLLPLILDAALRSDEGFDPLGPRASALVPIFEAANDVRDRLLGDPRASDIAAGLVAREVDLLEWDTDISEPTPRASGDTVAIVVTDDAGNSISMLQSLFLSFGSGLLDRETGILAHDRGAYFSLDPESPNVIAGGKRPAHTLTPCTVFQDGRLRTTIATAGGFGQPQILAQILLRLLLGEDPVTAMAAPRWVVTGPGIIDEGDMIIVEDDLPALASQSLATSLLRVRSVSEVDKIVSNAQLFLGHAQLIVHEEDGQFAAASDPRSEGSAMVVRR